MCKMKARAQVKFVKRVKFSSLEIQFCKNSSFRWGESFWKIFNLDIHKMAFPKSLHG